MFSNMANKKKMSEKKVKKAGKRSQCICVVYRYFVTFLGKKWKDILEEPPKVSASELMRDHDYMGILVSILLYIMMTFEYIK